MDLMNLESNCTVAPLRFLRAHQVVLGTQLVLLVRQFGGPSRSQKKKQKKHGDMRKQLFAAIGIVNVLYLLAPFTLYSEEVEFPWRLFAMHTVLSAYLTRLVLNSVLSGYDYEYAPSPLVLDLDSLLTLHLRQILLRHPGDQLVHTSHGDLLGQRLLPFPTRKRLQYVVGYRGIHRDFVNSRRPLSHISYCAGWLTGSSHVSLICNFDYRHNERNAFYSNRSRDRRGSASESR